MCKQNMELLSNYLFKELIRGPLEKTTESLCQPNGERAKKLPLYIEAIRPMENSSRGNCHALVCFFAVSRKRPNLMKGLVTIQYKTLKKFLILMTANCKIKLMIKF